MPSALHVNTNAVYKTKADVMYRVNVSEDLDSLQVSMYWFRLVQTRQHFSHP